MEVTADQGIVGILVVTLVAGFKEGGMPKWMTGMAVVALGAIGGLVFIDVSVAGAATGVTTAFFTAGVYGVITNLDKAGKPAVEQSITIDDAALTEALRRILAGGALLDDTVPMGGTPANDAARNIQTYLDDQRVDTQPANVRHVAAGVRTAVR